jgi:hypothetical protein
MKLHPYAQTTRNLLAREAHLINNSPRGGRAQVVQSLQALVSICATEMSTRVNEMRESIEADKMRSQVKRPPF